MFWQSDRRAATVHFIDEPDPSKIRDLLITVEDRHRDQAGMRLGLLALSDVSHTSQRMADAFMDEVIARLEVVLDGFRLRGPDLVSSYSKENFRERIATFDGVRPDGHPVWIQVERMIYPMRIPGVPDGDLYQLGLYVTTDHGATVGQELLPRWDEALVEGAEPLTSVLAVLGDPLAGKVEPGDRFVPVGGDPIDLLELFGGGG